MMTAWDEIKTEALQWKRIKEKYTSCGLCTIVEDKREVILNEKCDHYPEFYYHKGQEISFKEAIKNGLLNQNE